MNQPMRLKQGGHIDRTKTLEFRFNKVSYHGYAGDTLASALLANAQRLVGRSFKYHRPRGIMTNGPEEPNAMVQLEQGAYTRPNVLATMQPLYHQLEAASQNCWPSVNFDLLALNQVFAPMLPAGFYYKTFMHPQSWWMRYEHWIRKAAGLGKTSGQADPERYIQYHEHVDVLVVGAGPAGLAAALAAARRGASVLLVDERQDFGGSLWHEPAQEVEDPERAVRIDDHTPLDWVRHTIAELSQMPQVRLLPRTTITHYGHQNYLIGAQRLRDQHKPSGGEASTATAEISQILWRIRAAHVVLATGAIERLPSFSNNDRPGVMLSSALRGYINHYAVLPGQTVCVFTNNDSGYRTALDAAQAGATVQILDARPFTQHPNAQAALRQGIAVQMGAVVTGVTGSGRVRDVHNRSIDEDGQINWSTKRVIAADILAVSSGYTPTVHLYSQAKGKLKFDDTIQGYVPDGIACAATVCGSANGEISLARCIQSGHAAGASAAEKTGHKGAASLVANVFDPTGEYPFSLRPLFMIDDNPLKASTGKRFVDIQNDSTVADLALARREGFLSIEHVKRYTTTGMGTDQGKLANINAIGIMAQLSGRSIPEVGMTTYRPPYTPLSFGAIVGAARGPLFEQVRTTPMHAWHVEHGAVFEDVGDWKRARYYPCAGEDMHAATQRESLAVREHGGIFDGSTLGKIDIQGVDAVKLLNMLYTNGWSKLAVGQCRYGVMLNEHGMIFDDGVTTRLGEYHYHMTTTTGGAARVLEWIEEMLQTEWLDWKVHATSVTEEWAVVTLNGPKVRSILQKVCGNQAIDADTLPFMRYAPLEVAGVPCRVFRISFTGELAFEINVPASYGLKVWQALIEAGGDDLTPYGTEAMHLLRAEKGFIIVGQDTDGTVTPLDANLSWLVSKTKADFLGKRSLTRSDTARDDRKQLVGLSTNNGYTVLPEGTHLIASTTVTPPMYSEGHITSSYYSPILQQPIALALIKRGLSRLGETLYAVDPATNNTTAMTIVDGVFYDKDGGKARG